MSDELSTSRPEPPVFGSGPILSQHDPREDYDDDFAHLQSPAERAKRKLQGPASAFVVIGMMGMLGSLFGAAMVLVAQSGGAMQNDERLAIMIICLVFLAIGVSLFLVVLIAGICMFRMQHRGLAFVGAYIVTGFALVGAYAVLFFPFGIWALVVLFQPDVKLAFAQTDAKPTEPAND